MNKNVERGQATRAHLVGVATRLFAAHGYDSTSIEMVLAESGASRGSLYHHFKGKEALFEAVLESVGTRIAAEVGEAIAGISEPLAAQRAGALAWIRLACDPVVRQIILIDEPAVLGWERWRAFDEMTTLPAIRDVLTYAAQAGHIEASHVDAFAHIALAATTEVAMMIARSDDPAATLRAVESAYTEFLDRLLGYPDERSGPATASTRVQRH